MTNVERVLDAFLSNPIRLSYSYERLMKQYSATKEEVQEAKTKFNENENTGWQVKHKWIKTETESSFLVKQTPDVDFCAEFASFIENIPSPSLSPAPVKHTGATAIVGMFDIHLGKIAFSHYTGNIDNLETQEDVYHDEFATLLSWLLQQNIKKIILPIGNDFFNVDDVRLTTTKGTLQDNTKDLYSMFTLGLELLTYTINQLKQYWEVDVILVPGNHATVLETNLAVAIRKIYENTQGVTVDARPLGRKYIQIGQTCVGLGHGQLKMEKYADLLPFEAKDIFSKTKYHEVLVGDKHIEQVHKKSVDEFNSVVVRRLAALTRTDLWHYTEGYTLSRRRSYVLLYGENSGMTQQYCHVSEY